MDQVTPGVIGLGSMGFGAAASLLRAGFPAQGCDVAPARASRFAAAGGRLAADPAALAAACDVVAVFVVNADQIEAVLFASGAVAAARPGTVFILSATIPPTRAEDFGRRLRDAGMLPIDAPVSGGAAKAAAGAMTIMASGPPAAFERADPVLAGDRRPGVPARRRARRRQPDEARQPAPRRRPHRRGGRGAGAGDRHGPRPAPGDRDDPRLRRHLVDVREPRAAHRRRRLRAALGGRHLRQGPRHRARGGRPAGPRPGARGPGARAVPRAPPPPAGAATTTRRSRRSTRGDAGIAPARRGRRHDPRGDRRRLHRLVRPRADAGQGRHAHGAVRRRAGRARRCRACRPASWR